MNRNQATSAPKFTGSPHSEQRQEAVFARVIGGLRPPSIPPDHLAFLSDLRDKVVRVGLKMSLSFRAAHGRAATPGDEFNEVLDSLDSEVLGRQASIDGLDMSDINAALDRLRSSFTAKGESAWDNWRQGDHHRTAGRLLFEVLAEIDQRLLSTEQKGLLGKLGEASRRSDPFGLPSMAIVTTYAGLLLTPQKLLGTSLEQAFPSITPNEMNQRICGPFIVDSVGVKDLRRLDEYDARIYRLTANDCSAEKSRGVRYEDCRVAAALAIEAACIEPWLSRNTETGFAIANEWLIRKCGHIITQPFGLISFRQHEEFSAAISDHILSLIPPAAKFFVRRGIVRPRIENLANWMMANATPVPD